MLYALFFYSKAAQSYLEVLNLAGHTCIQHRLTSAAHQIYINLVLSLANHACSAYGSLGRILAYCLNPIPVVTIDCSYLGSLVYSGRKQISQVLGRSCFQMFCFIRESYGLQNCAGG